MTIAIIGGEFDLSVGSILPFSTLLFAYLMPRIGYLCVYVRYIDHGGRDRGGEWFLCLRS